MGLLHGTICSLPRVNDIAVGIALMLFGVGLADYLGKPFIQPAAPQLPAIDFAWWSGSPDVQNAFKINALFLIGVALAPLLAWALSRHPLGPHPAHRRRERRRRPRARAIRSSRCASSRPAAAAFSPASAGSFLSLYYPGAWSERISSGQGITAVALVIFARWNPKLCFYASLLFGGAGALGPSLQGARHPRRLLPASTPRPTS